MSVDLSPFRTIVRLHSARPLVLETRLLDFTRDIFSPWNGEGDLGLSCPSTSWPDDFEIIQYSLRHIDFFWDGQEQPARWHDGDDVTAAPDQVLPQIDRRTFALNAAAYDITYTHFNNTYAAFWPRWWMPPEAPRMPDRAGYYEGNTLTLRTYGHSAGGPRLCVRGSTHARIVEASRLRVTDPPETIENDLKIIDEFDITFADQIVSGVSYEPFAVSPLHKQPTRMNIGWADGARPYARVLYRRKPTAGGAT